MVSKKIVILRFTFKIAFFLVFKNDNILSSKSYTVTKSEISPQRKLGSLQNLKLKLIRYKLTTRLFFVKFRARTTRVQTQCTRVYGSCGCACTDLYEKIFGGQLLSHKLMFWVSCFIKIRAIDEEIFCFLYPCMIRKYCHFQNQKKMQF